MANTSTNDAVTKVNIPERPVDRSGKVRDLFDLGDKMLLVASDRISAFDSILGSPIPGKGKILTQISLFWFDFVKDIIQNHIISSNTADFPEPFNKYPEILDKRSMLVKKTKVIPIECVVRGYLSGSGWKDYKQSGAICGIELPKGLKESSKLPEPIFTPSTKAESGHDLPVTEEEVKKIVGEEVTKTIKEKSLAIYNKAADYALGRGIIIADTKFEFGISDGRIILIDEILTPDSSRFWPLDQYKEGQSQPSYDKQFVRDYLEEIKWDKEPPAPGLPDAIINKTYNKYFEAYGKLTGKNSL
ncbi:MAG: phosphoribosylaminoimidazolesuccinocarboxamide synthase [Candidatus Margulisbacteria bacterium]|nr:phosphoribosylaminoimidazolesuccinocarboxamide synthase [Candidatus Margulisiibacteriota bacterium]MBU1022545.1 phosphoribosylaminoimidazolesuccinocarboxamide synthase [Candidatus Margulisiibacteriota bacterium]MBU1728831.1 phosphoribosylaminoimidazolesuccinocarboxamide synthase [Candidatus Margulisiibacteriota bacterium]MBU1955797.1 phosphoribosylaminoimidazolesuccinocarboxamide synthase [Candidatus Margulisiibacteriota bacterium]